MIIVGLIAYSALYCSGGTSCIASPESVAHKCNGNTVNVFSPAFGRQHVIQPIMNELQLQARYRAPYREGSVTRQVKAPGNYPIELGMRICDLIRTGGNGSEQAHAMNAKVARRMEEGA